LGAVEREVGDWDVGRLHLVEATVLGDALVARDPKNPGWVRQRGLVMVLSCGLELQEGHRAAAELWCGRALADARRAVELDPSDRASPRTLQGVLVRNGQVALLAGNLDGARRFAGEAERLPDVGDANVATLTGAIELKELLGELATAAGRFA